MATRDFSFSPFSASKVAEPAGFFLQYQNRNRKTWRFKEFSYYKGFLEGSGCPERLEDQLAAVYL